jgi:hypothetical protein
MAGGSADKAAIQPVEVHSYLAQQAQQSLPADRYKARLLKSTLQISA